MIASTASALRRTSALKRVEDALLRSWRQDAIAGSPFFDPAWYLEHNGDVQEAGADPLDHFLRHGEAEGRNPGPIFDSAAYVAMHPDASGAALTHFHRTTLARVSASEAPAPALVNQAPTDPVLDRPLVQPRVRPRADLTDLNVCVMVHAYYVDVLASILDRLWTLPAVPTLLVSVATTSDAANAHRAIDAVLGPDQPRIVKVAPNRGRNFAPLLCSFADEIREHDHLLHLHTKKSLHTGVEQSDWRTHLVTSLLPSAAGVDAILSLLADDPTVGVVQAPTWEGVPHYGNYWLGNSPKGTELYARIGVDDRRAHGYLSYPVGGMFWARVDALRPLLDLGLTVGDFDRELGQTDGTLAHAIERTIPAAAATAGFDTVEFDHNAAQWRRNWSAGDVPEFGSTRVEALRTALHAADLVSVDLFDTLVLWPTLDPEALFDVLGFRFDAASPSAESMFSGKELVSLRRESEARLRHHHDFAGDVTLDEIYAAARSEQPSQAGRLDLLQQFELDLVRNVAIPQTWLIEELLDDRAQPTVGDAHRRYVLVTDTTHPVDVIEGLLLDVGAGDLFDEIYVSSACRARKDTGSMWELVHSRESPEAGRWLHIGHDAFSDVKQAVERDIASFHVPAPGLIAQSRGVDSSLLGNATRAGTQLVAGHGLAALASHRLRPGRVSTSPDDSAIDNFGYGVLGPLTLSFATWLIHTARDRNISRLLVAEPVNGLALEALRRVLPHLSADALRVDDASPSVQRSDLDFSSDRHIGIVDVDASGLSQQTLAPLVDHDITKLYFCDARAVHESGSATLSCFRPGVRRSDPHPFGANARTWQLLFAAARPQISTELDSRVEMARVAAIHFIDDHIARFGPESLDARVDPAVVRDALEQTLRATMPELDTVITMFAHDDLSTAPNV